jgi:ferredoxin
MADKNDKVNGNVSGKYYVDSNCSGCGLCEGEAPDNFKLNDDGLAIVFKQPESDTEIEACDSVIEDCPAESIGNDGE